MKECQNIEFKETWSDDYLKWICGFANAQGGKLYIGVDDSENIVGIQNARKLLEDIPNKIVTTLGIVAEVNLLKKILLNILKLLFLRPVCLLLTVEHIIIDPAVQNRSYAERHCRTFY